MTPAYVAGVGLWAPGYDSPLAHAGEPVAKLLNPRIARRTSLLTRMAAEAVGQAATHAEPASTPVVFASAYGETETLGALLEMLYGDGDLSPTRFHNSVTNTAVGYLSISTGNRSFSTAIDAGYDTVAMGLLEALGLLAERGGDVLVVFADETPPAPFPREGLASLAVALHLRADRPADGSLSLGELRPARTVAEVPAAFRENPVAPALSLYEAIRARRSGTVPLSSRPGGWEIDLR